MLWQVVPGAKATTEKEADEVTTTVRRRDGGRERERDVAAATDYEQRQRQTVNVAADLRRLTIGRVARWREDKFLWVLFDFFNLLEC